MVQKRQQTPIIALRNSESELTVRGKVAIAGQLALTVIAVFTSVFSGHLYAESPAATSVELPPVLLQMLRNRSVFDDLELSASQRSQVRELMSPIDHQWWGCRNLPDSERIATVKKLTAAAKQNFKEQLPTKSFTRLEQLEKQALGTRMFLMPDVAKSLGLGTETIQRLEKQAMETNTKTAELNRRLQAGEPLEKINDELNELTKKERVVAVELLTSGQKARLTEITGKPFAFNTIRRQLPEPPELVATDKQWLQGVPTTLQQLRGKVVVVHFYAFQCINCQRNLPHYAAWHRDFSEQGLEVIGIQTPETESEHHPDKVADAAKRSDIQYRVLMDQDSKNWSNWGTTMWPTVYVIDRDGYLRSWWQGELNWQSNPGEQKMRELIKQLLDEKADS